MPVQRSCCTCDCSARRKPYSTVEDLPPSVRQHLPVHAQEVFTAAFNNAFRFREGEPRQDEIAFRMALAAEKRIYVKVHGNWVPRDPGAFHGQVDVGQGDC